MRFYITTRFPGDKEKDRKIIGLFKIGRVTNAESEETKFFADEESRIRLPLEEAKQLFFWDYYSIDSEEPLWGTGLFRYLNDTQMKKLLLDLKRTLQSNHHKEIVKKLLMNFENIEPFGNGLRNTLDARHKRIIEKRKYGAGGEGENHKRLKEWISSNPQAIGLSNVNYAEMEYSFPSGDAVDILFKLDDGTEAVVEIETTIPEPGSYQAIKYRALRCAEKLLSLDSKKVQAFLVAWGIPLNLREFCEKYDIKWYEIVK